VGSGSRLAFPLHLASCSLAPPQLGIFEIGPELLTSAVLLGVTYSNAYSLLPILRECVSSGLAIECTRIISPRK